MEILGDEPNLQPLQYLPLGFQISHNALQSHFSSDSIQI